MKKEDDITRLKKKLLPILERAAVGDYSKDIKLEKNDPLNVIYGGVQILINTIREQSIELQGLSKPSAKHRYVSARPKLRTKLIKSHYIPLKKRPDS